MGDLALSFICHMVVWQGEMPPPSLTPLCLWQVVELVLRSQEWENCPCPSPAAALRKVVPGGAGVGELTLMEPPLIHVHHRAMLESSPWWC